jgi:hypothetical protein
MKTRNKFQASTAERKHINAGKVRKQNQREEKYTKNVTTKK